MAKPIIQHDILISMLAYDAVTGVFTWKIKAGKSGIGKVAGRVGRLGYRQIRVRGTHYLAHRLAWYYVHGEWPRLDIDHIDTNKDNNAISNLRLATQSENMANRGLTRSNTTGFKGIQSRPNGRWRASREINRKWISLGTYGSKEEASAAYMRSLEATHGKFARAS